MLMLAVIAFILVFLATLVRRAITALPPEDHQSWFEVLEDPDQRFK